LTNKEMVETHKHQDFAETNKLKNLSKADISKEIININENKKINKYSDVFKNAEKISLSTHKSN